MRSEAWRPAAAACNRSSREAREPARQALRPGCEELAVTDPAQMPEREARPRGPKPPRRSAERRASRVMGRKAPRKAPGLPRYVQAPRVFRRAPERFSALRPPLFGASEAKVASLGRQRVARTRRSGLFEIVSCERRDARPHPEERARRRRSANFERVRASRRMRTDAPSCFETHRSATMLGRKRARSRCDAPQHEGRGGTAHFGEAKPMCPHWKSSPRKRGPMITGRWSWVPALRRRTDPRLQETIAGSVPLFADCYLQ